MQDITREDIGRLESLFERMEKAQQEMHDKSGIIFFSNSRMYRHGTMIRCRSGCRILL